MFATNPGHTFAAIAYNEVLLNSKRVVPYVLMLLFVGNAVLWWFRGPAIALGWATNSDFYIVRKLLAFSFLTGLPLFNAVIMSDSVIRDFRVGIDPLLFSKPISRSVYLLGKFAGNFFVLVCCQLAFIVTSIVLQLFPTSLMVVQPFRVWPYFKHFFFFVVISHLLLAAFYFSVGTLTRNAKIVYGLAIGFYPVYIAYQILLLKGLPQSWTVFLDPLLINTSLKGNGFLHTAEFLNQLVIVYTPVMFSNRALVILGAVVCVAITYLKFTTQERAHLKQHSSRVKVSAVMKFDKLRTGAAIVYNEMLLNSKRVAPYIVAMLCAGNAVLWWGWGPAIGRGWATNSDFFIAGVLPIYSFLFLPLYTAIIMADPAIRDFTAGIDPLIFSKPITRAQYILGKFFGNFFTLAFCQSFFVWTLFVLQWVPKKGMIVQEPKFFLYPKHFLVFVAMSHMLLAAFYFTVGTLTRNTKIVYGLGILFYPLIIIYNLAFLNKLPSRWAIILDPLVMRWNNLKLTSVEVINGVAVVYDSNLIINRSLMILLTATCLTILYRRFSTTERSGPVENFSVLNLSTAAQRVYYPEPPAGFEGPYDKAAELITRVAIPQVVRVNKGIRSNLNKLVAALDIEFRLLRAERSLVVVMPLAIFVSILEVTFYNIPPDISHSVASATNTAKLLLLPLIGMAVFYTSEALHRDREVKIESVVWSTPVPNSVLLISKWLATIVLTFSLIAAVGLIAILVQLVRGHLPLDLSAYVMVYGVVLVPAVILITSLVVALNVLLRNKYLVYVIVVGSGAGLSYLYNVGYNHWLYNPILYQLWKYSDLTSGRILGYRLYCLALAAACLALAHLFFERKSR